MAVMMTLPLTAAITFVIVLTQVGGFVTKSNIDGNRAAGNLDDGVYGDSHAVPTYFMKVDQSGSFIPREKPEYDQVLRHLIINDIPAEWSGATLKVTPPVVDNGGRVVVKWAGMENPQRDDIIAFYCPVDDEAAHYLDYIKVSEAKHESESESESDTERESETENGSGTWIRGYGSFSVKVYNMRSDCVFRYYRGDGDVSRLAAVSNILSFANGRSQAPLHGHLSLTGKPTEMRVMWVSGKHQEQAFVRYGTSEQLINVEDNVLVSTYTAEDMCEAPADSIGFWKPGYIHDALLSKLTPNTKYFYQYGTKSYMSNIFYFTTAIAAGDPVPYKFIVYGDMGVGLPPKGLLTAKNVYKDITADSAYRFVFHHGDISYARGYAYLWDIWFKVIQPYATLVPYMVGIGNHEQDHVDGTAKDPSLLPGESTFRPVWGNYNRDSGGECGVPTSKRFHMPDNGNQLWWYSYEYGLTHMIMMSTEHDFTPGSRQYRWLDKDLASIDRAKTPWVIFGGHRAMYNSQLVPSDYVVSINMQRLFEDLLYKYKVDIAFWAHYHSYERTCKLYKGECVSDGVLHITVGTAGMIADPNFWFKKKWSVFHGNHYGYGRVTVANSTSLYWEWVENRSHKPKDSVWLHK